MDLITADEKAKLEGRLEELKAQRPIISQRIADARAASRHSYA